MRELAEAIRLLDQQVAIKQARCVIADEGWPGESSLLGTRDGYLNLALALLRFVADSDMGCFWIADQSHAWDDGVKAALYQLPTQSAAWLVGMYLFRSHAEFMADLSRLVNPQIEHPLLNDPRCQAPGGSGSGPEGSVDLVAPDVTKNSETQKGDAAMSQPRRRDEL